MVLANLRGFVKGKKYDDELFSELTVSVWCALPPRLCKVVEILAIVSPALNAAHWCLTCNSLCVFLAAASTP